VRIPLLEMRPQFERQVAVMLLMQLHRTGAVTCAIMQVYFTLIRVSDHSLNVLLRSPFTRPCAHPPLRVSIYKRFRCRLAPSPYLASAQVGTYQAWFSSRARARRALDIIRVSHSLWFTRTCDSRLWFASLLTINYKHAEKYGLSSIYTRTARI
jgi:hypothetical protein